jgi:UDP-N-acetylglucosamine 3-dehydrogenase
MINVVVVGVGSMGRNHARNYYDLKNANLVAVCDSDENSAKEIAALYGVKYYLNHKELIKRERLDAASIAVSTKQHKRIALDFIKNKTHVLVEKPLASNAKDAKDLVREAKKNKVVLAVGHVERFNPAVIKLQELINDGEFGEILAIVVRRVGFFPSRITDTDVVTDLAVHDLDVITSLISRLPISVFARGGGGISNSREDHAEIFLDYGKFGCFIQVNWVTPIKIRELNITGTKGYAQLNYMTQQLEVFKSKYKVKEPKGFEEFIEKYGEPKRKRIRINKKEPLRLELEDFIASVEGNKKPKVIGMDGLIAVELTENILESIRSNRVVNIR